jgi:heterodisulfide reductase subunit A
LKDKNPDMNIYILFREMRTFGERENIYKEARQKGVIFIRYDLDGKPVVEDKKKDGKATVTVRDHILGRTIAMEADLISLQTGIVSTAAKDLSSIFHVDLDEDGFYAESPEKMRPQDATVKGVFTAGLAHYPKDTTASIGQAKAAAARALEILSRDTVETGGLVAEVRAEKCAVCCTCVRTCPFGVPVIDRTRGAAWIDPGLCRGCGMCVAECPGKAIVMGTCSDPMLNQAPVVLLETKA